jgi:hypothetical protein
MLESERRLLIDMPEDSDAQRFLYSVERQELPGQPAIGRIVCARRRRPSESPIETSGA